MFSVDVERIIKSQAHAEKIDCMMMSPERNELSYLILSVVSGSPNDGTSTLELPLNRSLAQHVTKGSSTTQLVLRNARSP